MKKALLLLAFLIFHYIGIAQTDKSFKNLTVTGNLIIYGNTTIRNGDLLVKKITGYNNNNMFVTTVCPPTLSGDYNYVFGFNAGASLTSGSSNFLGGDFAGALLTTGAGNLFLGPYSGAHLTNVINMCIINGLNRSNAYGDLNRSPIVIYNADSTINQRIEFKGKTFYSEDATFAKEIIYPVTNLSAYGTNLTYTPNTVLNTPFRLAFTLTNTKATNMVWSGDTSLNPAKAGNYIITLSVGFTGTAAGEKYKISIFKNNTVVTTSCLIVTTTGASYYVGGTWSWDLQGLSASDKITFKVTNLTNGNDPTFKEVMLLANKKPE